MKKLKINMLSSSEKVAGQGVSGAYRELLLLLKSEPNNFEITENEFRGKFDITHYHTIDPVFYLTTFFKRFGTKVGYVHFLPETLKGSLQIPHFLMPLASKYIVNFYNRMDKLVVVNPIFIKELTKLGIPEEKVTYIPNFVNKKKWFPSSADDYHNFRQNKGWGDKLVVLGAGQIQKRKGVDDFIQLALKNPDVLFVWAGGFSFGKITEGYYDYKKIIHNPPPNLIFTNIIPREEMRLHYACADLFFLPSFNELFPMSILEAASCETPIMLRDLELYQVILKGKYIPAKNLDEMNAKIQKIAENPLILKEYSEKSKDISNQYSEEALLKIWEDFYNN